jgi:hypothetical protein
MTCSWPFHVEIVEIAGSTELVHRTRQANSPSDELEVRARPGSSKMHRQFTAAECKRLVVFRSFETVCGVTFWGLRLIRLSILSSSFAMKQSPRLHGLSVDVLAFRQCGRAACETAFRPRQVVDRGDAAIK